MPFDNKFDQTYEAITKAPQQILGCEILIERADNIAAHASLEVAERVKGLITNSSFCIADITGKNPNVMWEYGYAAGKGKEVILITQDKTHSIPTNIRGVYFEKYSPEIDKGLEAFTQRIALFMKEAVKKIETVHTSRTVSNMFDVTCYNNRDAAQLKNLFSKAEKYIDILQTNLASVHNYIDSLKNALKQSEEGNGNLQVRILTLDPESDFAARRAKQLGIGIRKFRKELTDSLEKFYEIFVPNYEEVEIRTYDDFPLQITFRIDDQIIHSVVSVNQQSRNNNTFQMDLSDMGAQETFVSHFNRLWANSTEYQPVKAYPPPS